MPYSLRDRWALAGMTQTGKTTAALQVIIRYLERYPGLRVHILDPKDVGDYTRLAAYASVVHVREGPAPDLLRQPGVLIWHPRGASWDDYEAWFARINADKRPSLTVLDEIKRLQRRSADSWSFPPSLGVLMREGAGQYHATISLIQEIAGGAAREILSQATHLLRFRLENEYDERIANRRFARARRMGHIKGLEPHHWHGFWHARIDALDSAREYASWQHFL